MAKINNITTYCNEWYYNSINNIDIDNAKNKQLIWNSSNTNVATVHPNTGSIFGVSPGVATITARTVNGCEQDSFDVTVLEVALSDLVIVEQNIVLDVNCCKKLTLKYAPGNATYKGVKWWSDDTSIVTVDSSGTVCGRKSGTTNIHVQSQHNKDIVTTREVRVTGVTEYVEGKTEGTVKPSGSSVQDPIDVFSGAHTIKNTVMSLYGGQNIKLELNYDSTRLSCGIFGKGWYHNFEKHIEFCDCSAEVFSSPTIYTRYTANDDKTVYTATTANKNGYVLTVNEQQNNPYIIDCNKDHTEHFDIYGRLAKIVDHYGFETNIEYSQGLITVSDSIIGKSIQITLNECYLATKVSDGEREAFFEYENGMLTKITDVNGHSLTFTYNSRGQVLTGIDSKGVCYFTNTYDEFARVATQKDAIEGGVASRIEYGCCNDRTTVDRNQKASKRIFNDDGLLEKLIDENGNTTTYQYDERYNIIKETDALGNSIIKSYNNFNKPVSITDKNGNTTTIEYDDNGNVTKIKYPDVDGAVCEESFGYNSRNQLVSHTDLRGTTTVYTYDDSGLLASKKVGDKNAITYQYNNGYQTYLTDANGKTTAYGYNSIGQLTSVTNAENKTTLYEYDAVGNLLKTTDANEKTVINTYDGNNCKTSVTDANGKTTTYSYNGNLKNDVIIQPDNRTVSYEFDGEDRVTKIIDQAKNVTIITYDNAGRVVTKQFADDSSVTYELDAVGNVIKEINAKGAVTLKEYDAMGNVISVTDDQGNVTRYQYNSFNKVIRVVSATAGCVLHKYSPAGDLLCTTDALGNKVSYTYDAFGNKLSATDARGNVTRYTYDANNNLLTVTDALGNVTRYTYNSLNQLVTVTDANNHTLTYGYDAIGRRITVTDAKNNTFTTTYDGNGNVLKTLDAFGKVISESEYNDINLPSKITDAQGKTTNYTYTELGKVKTAVDSLLNRQEYFYDAVGRNTSVLDALNNTSSVIYDALGNITHLSGPLGSTIDYTYDDMGRLTSESTCSGGTKSYEYNKLNIRKKITNARAQIHQVFHDAMGRITGYTSHEDSVSYTYDDSGNVLCVTDKNGIIKREYDALNRITKLTDTFGKTIQYTYDAVGNLASIIYPDNTAVTYAYDENNNLKSVTDWAGRVTTYSYDANNRVVGVIKPDGSVTTTVYDNAQRVVSTVEKTASNVVITGFEYTYDNLSRIVEEKHLADNTRICYTYDRLSRVTKRTVYNECNQIVSSENFTYDAAGNITDAPNSCFMYDANNRLITFNGNTVSYDMDGNMLSNGYINCEFDSGNRLISAGGHTYTYNAEDVRIRNLCSDADTTYTYNINCRLSQLLCKTTNGITTKYVYGLGLIGEEKYGEFKTYHFDFRGSTVALTDEYGNITDRFKYDTYGKMTEHIGNSYVIFGYNGRDGVVTDRNGLLYMRTRYYSPDMRRFINADIISGEISNAITLNRYAYANGNPVSNTDPFGLAVDERGNNDNIIASLKEIYHVAYGYYKGVFSTKQRVNLANLLTMRYIMLDRYYSKGLKQGTAWTIVAGAMNREQMSYMQSKVSNDTLENATYYDNLNKEIDFGHLIATLAALQNYSVMDSKFNDYAGWAGDLISMAGNVQGALTESPNSNIPDVVNTFMSGDEKSNFSPNDLFADMDAYLINQDLSGKPIYEVIERYYSGDVTSRCTQFYDKRFNSDKATVKNEATKYLKKSMMTETFRDVFGSNYDYKYVDSIADAFSEYLYSLS